MTSTNGAYNRVRSEVEKAANAALAAKAKIAKYNNLSDVYREEHLAEQRAKIASEARGEIEAHLGSAAKSLEDARVRARKELEKRRKVDPAQLAATTAQLQMVLGNSLAEQPERLLDLYEMSFDNPVERRVIEDLAQRVIRVMPHSAQKMRFADRWEERQRSLVDKLPEEERQVLAEIEAVDRIAEDYLTPASKALDYAIARWAGERHDSSPDFDVRVEKLRAFDQERGEQESPFEQLPHTVMNQEAWRDL
jgi:hypothetical protein